MATAQEQPPCASHDESERVDDDLRQSRKSLKQRIYDCKNHISQSINNFKSLDPSFKRPLYLIWLFGAGIYAMLGYLIARGG